MRKGSWRVAVVLVVIVVLVVTGGLGPWGPPGPRLRAVIEYLQDVVLVGVPLFFIVRAAIISAARAIDPNTPTRGR